MQDIGNLMRICCDKSGRGGGGRRWRRWRRPPGVEECGVKAREGPESQRQTVSCSVVEDSENDSRANCGFKVTYCFKFTSSI